MSSNPNDIPRSLESLLSGIFDYAGMFPPANLSLVEAWRRFVAYDASTERWLVAAFVCPAAKIAELTRLSSDSPVRTERPWPISLLGRATTTATEAIDSWATDLAPAFAQRLDNRDLADKLEIAAFEVKLPSDSLESTESLVNLIDEVRDAWDLTAHHPGGRVFFELPRDAHWPRTVDVAVSALAALPDEVRSAVGLKIRTGGVEPSAFPTPREVAEFLVACRDARIAWKATAGLHHPVRHLAKDLGCPMHGFLNLSVAAVVAQIYNLSLDDVEEILVDECSDSFQFDDEALAWNDIEAPLDAIQHIRQRQFLSIGSCSIDEPREDLRRLGWV